MRLRSLALLAAAVWCGCDRKGGDSGDAGIGGDGGIDAAIGDDGVRQVAQINLTFTQSCAPDFDQDIVVVSDSGSVAVSTTQGAGFASIQFDLQQSQGEIMLSTSERVANGDIVNLVAAGTTWTNISDDAVDPIDGDLDIFAYQESAGVIDLLFDNVVLQNVSDDSLCGIDGALVTFGTSF